MVEKTIPEVTTASGQNRLYTNLQTGVSQLDENNRSCLLGIELALLFAQNSVSSSIVESDFESVFV
ncbi:hypothetical protein AGMMS50212_06560 [Spirochaetia bacterium]|nr:hypothetical protein AGMMS50212_06560 [Spirochaetia bacterium]